jgi:hypothetical protein
MAKKEEFNEIITYYKKFLFVSKKKDIILLENFFKNSKIQTDYEKYLKDYKTAKIVNERESIIMLLFNKKRKDNNHNKDDKKREEEIQRFIQEWNQIEKDINDKKYQKIKNNKRKSLVKYFNNDNNKEILLKIFQEDIYNSLINAIKEDNNNNAENESNEKEENERNNFYNGKELLENEITSHSENSIIVEGVIDETNNDNKNKKNDKSKVEIQSIIYNSVNQKEGNYDESCYEIMHYVDTIGKHRESAESIQEIGQRYYISRGLDNVLSIYSQDYKNIMNIESKENICSISEEKTEEMLQNNKINLLLSEKEKIIQMDIDISKKQVKFQKNTDIYISSSLLLEVKKNKHLVCGYKGIYEVNDLCSRIIYTKINQIYNKSYIGGIVINDDLVAVTSNEILRKGEDCLKFYNVKPRKFLKSINGYSFIKSTNGLTLFPTTAQNFKIVLCACKKYKKSQKNGILLINIKQNQKIEIVHSFYHTKNFEVFCFCPIGIKDNKKAIRIFDDLNYNNLNYTNYFLVGGYDQEKSRGIIKLFKLIKNDNELESTIEYIQDIDIEKTKKFEGFKEPINCIIQNKRNGDILVTSWDGGVYLLSPPKMDIFLRQDQIDLQCNYPKEDNVIIIGVE